MKNRTPVICDRCRRTGYLGHGEFTGLKPALEFTPVPRKTKRHDGWTPTRQRGFIEALARTGSVSQAAAAVNMAKEGAYQLRLHPEAAEFRAAWDTALDYGVHILSDAAMDRAIHGVPVPIMHEGKQVAERRTFNERLTMWQLQHRMPEQFGKPGGEGTKAPETEQREEQEAYAKAYQDSLAAWRSIAQLMAMMHGAGTIAGRLREAGDTEAADNWDSFYADTQYHLKARSTLLFVDMYLDLHGRELQAHSHWPKHLSLEKTGEDWG